MVLHPGVDALGNCCRFAEVYCLHLCSEVLLHQVQEVGVEADAFLQEETVGESNHVVGVVIGKSLGQVLEQGELHSWTAKRDSRFHTVTLK